MLTRTRILQTFLMPVVGKMTSAKIARMVLTRKMVQGTKKWAKSIEESITPIQIKMIISNFQSTYHSH